MKNEIKIGNINYLLSNSQKSLLYVHKDENNNIISISLECHLDRVLTDSEDENVLPSLTINNIDTSAINSLVGFSYEVKTVEESYKREDTFYYYEHEPFENYKLVINDYNDDFANISIVGTAIIDGYSKPYKTKQIEFHCVLPVKIFKKENNNEYLCDVPKDRIENNTLIKMENIIVIILLLSGILLMIFAFAKMIVPTIVSISTFLICGLMIEIKKKIKGKVKKNKYLTVNMNTEQQKREKKIQKNVRDMLTEETYNKLRNIRIGWDSEIIFFDEENIDSGQSGFRYAGFSDEIIDEWPGNEYVIIGYDPTDGCGPDPYIMKTNEKELPIYWLMTDGGDWEKPDKIANSFDDFIKIIDCLNKNLNSEHKPNKELILNEIAQINSNENMWYWKSLLESIVRNED